MFVEQLWRYPVKSMKGVPLQSIEVRDAGLAGDRGIVVVSEARGCVITARTHHRLLGLLGGFAPDGVTPTINFHRWDSPAANALVAEAVGEPVRLVTLEDPRRFDVLPLLVTTSSAVAAMGVDGRRFRPNIAIGGAEGLIEREWPGKRLRMGTVEIFAAQMRSRCVMTTYDPDSLVQDRSVLFKIVSDFEGTMGLDCSVVTPGTIQIGDTVEVLD